LKILIIRPRFIGDVLLTTPAVRTIKLHYPNSVIAYLTEEQPSEILKNNPYIDKIFIYNKVSINDIRKEKFDIVFDFWGSFKSAIYAYLSYAKKRIGFNYRFRKYFYNFVVKNESKLNAIEVYLDALRMIGIKYKESDERLEVFISKEDEEVAQKFFNENNIDTNKVTIGIFPGGSHPSKMWQKEKFASICNYFSNANIIIFEGPKEKGIGKQIQNLTNHKIIIAECIPINSLAAIIRKCNIFITDDGAPMHISVACGVKTIAIFGPGDASIWFPYTKYGHVAIQKNVGCCNKNICVKGHICMNSISAEEVIEKVNELIRRKVT
jgi:ADP-heptose:LPS heptosyltransferase